MNLPEHYATLHFGFRWTEQSYTKDSDLSVFYSDISEMSSAVVSVNIDKAIVSLIR